RTADHAGDARQSGLALVLLHHQDAARAGGHPEQRVVAVQAERMLARRDLGRPAALRTDDDGGHGAPRSPAPARMSATPWGGAGGAITRSPMRSSKETPIGTSRAIRRCSWSSGTPPDCVSRIRMRPGLGGA